MPITSQPKWIVFDAVGTLIDPAPSIAEAYWQIGHEFGTQYSVPEIHERFRIQFRSEFTGHGPGQYLSNEEIELARWKQIVKTVLDDVEDLDACFEEVHAHFSNPQAWQVFSDAAPTLERLKQLGYSLAIGSNFDNRLHDVCIGHDELKPIDVAFASAEIGFRKPSLSFYSKLSRRLNVSPAQMLMVGDHEENDVTSARKAGLSAILIDRSQPTCEKISRINDLSEVVSLLETD